MLTRRILAAICLSTIVVTGAAACGTSNDPTPDATPTSAASSAPVGAAANTSALCATLKAAMAPGQARLLEPNNTVASAKAVLTDWATALRSAAPQATDPQLEAALVELASKLDTVNAKVVTAQDLENWTILMTAPEVSAALGKFDLFCPPS